MKLKPYKTCKLHTEHFLIIMIIYLYIEILPDVFLGWSLDSNWIYHVCWQVDMYAGTIFIQQAIGLDIYVGVVILLAISAVYTVSGTTTPSQDIHIPDSSQASLFRYNLGNILFFHVNPLIAYTSCPLSSELLQHRIISCLSSKNVELYDIECKHIHVHLIHGSLPLLAILTFNFRCFDRWT